MYQKINNYEDIENKRKNQIDQNIIQLLKENEYLRKCNETFIGNIQVNENNENIRINCPKIKNKRSTTLLNFDFMKNQNTESNANDQETNIPDVKPNKKNKTAQKISIDIASSSSSNDSNNNIKVVTQAKPDGTTNYLSKKLDSHQTNIKPRQQYLFFKTPNNDESKKFDFSNKEVIDEALDEAKKSN